MIDFTYIRGNSYEGNSAIKELEKLGGINVYKYKGNIDSAIYYITNKDKFIRSASSSDDIYNVIEEYGVEIKLPKKKLPKTWEEWVKMNPAIKGEFYIDDYAHINRAQDDLFRNWDAQNNLSSKEDAEGLLALIKLKRLRDYYNDGWKPDWSNANQVKYVITLNCNNIITDTQLCHHSFLAFPTEKLSDEFLNNFKELIETAKMWL